MKQKQKLSFFFAVALGLIFLLTGCGATEYTAQKGVLLSSKTLQEKGNIPDDVFYSREYEKLAISFRSKNNKKLLAFYDVSSGKPVYYFETPYADDIFPPRFSENLNMTYALLIDNQWHIFLRALSALVGEAVPVFAIDSLNELVMLKQLRGIYALGIQSGTYGIYPPISKTTHFRIIEDFSLAPNQNLLFKGLKPDGNWVVYSDDQESEPYSFISKIVLPDEEGGVELGYVARDLQNNWFTIIGKKKTKLDKEYGEIGQVFVKSGQVIFSGVVKGQERWEISRDNKLLVAGLPTPPYFIVRENGKIVYTEDIERGTKYVIYGKKSSEPFSQIEQLLEDGHRNVFAKIKNQHGLWVVRTDETKSDQYVWMSKMFLDKGGNVFFFGVNPDGDLEFSKFYNK